MATTDVKEIDDQRKGDAYLAEVEHRGEQLDGRAWFRQQDPNFGLGQQNGGTSGMRTYGAEGAYRFNPQMEPGRRSVARGQPGHGRQARRGQPRRPITGRSATA